MSSKSLNLNQKGDKSGGKKRTCDPDESPERPAGGALPRGPVQPDPEAESRPAALHLHARQQPVDRACRLGSVHGGQGPVPLPAAPPGLSEGSLLEEDGVAAAWVADCIVLRKLNLGPLGLCPPPPLASALRSQADQQPQRPWETPPATAAAAAPGGGLHPPPKHFH